MEMFLIHTISLVRICAKRGVDDGVVQRGERGLDVVVVVFVFDEKLK